MRLLTPVGMILVLLLIPLIGNDSTVELAVLAPETWTEYAPEGKEVDAIYGDFVLRNEEVTAVIARPVRGRSANMTIRGVGGMLIDFTRRQSPNDQLGAYYPVRRDFDLEFAGIDTVAPSVHQSHTLEHLFVQAREITLRLTGNPVSGDPQVKVEYTLREESPYLLVKTIYANPWGEPLEFEVRDEIRADRSRDLRTPEKAPDGKAPLFWVYDKWFGQAYGWMIEGRELYAETGRGYNAASRLAYLDGGETRTVLGPGESLEIVRQVVAGANLLEVRAVANELAGVPQRQVTIRVTDRSGEPVPEADVVVFDGTEQYAWGRTGTEGQLEFALPEGAYRMEVSALGRGTFSASVNPSSESAHSIILDNAGSVRARVTDESGAPIPAKVQFHGRDETETPFFGPDSGDHGVHNVYYAHDGLFRQVLPPGRYEVIVSRGPEYDAVTRDLHIRAGEETPLEVRLVRSVETPGWISADFHSHSSPSGDNASSQLGRVLNLLAEHIEFAPCTEHNRISTYDPHLERLGAVHWMATCSGIELTNSPLSLNHQNAFPLRLRPHTQDGGAPLTSPDPEVQVERLALWDNASEKVVQQNHPDLGWLFFDRNGDGQVDGGYSRSFSYMDVIEIHPPELIFGPAVVEDSQGRVFNNRMFNWLQMLNQGYRIPGVVNTDAHANHHGSGFLRNYVKSPTDDPAAIRTADMVRAAKRGNIIMSNGPYLEVGLRPDGSNATKAAISGEEVKATTGKARLSIRVQCPKWFDVDRVQIFLNGRPEKHLNFTRAANSDGFSNQTVRFQADLDLAFREDTHVIVAAAGENSRLGPVVGPIHADDLPVAVSNPIYVDIEGDGFQPNKDTLDTPLPVKLQ